MTIGLVVITHNAVKLIEPCINRIRSSDINLEILVVNSSSTDGTIEKVNQLGVRLLIVPRLEFNHGKTREYARKKINTDVVVFMTPDALLVNSASLRFLVEPILSGGSSVSYSRQLPYIGSSFYESFPRINNYPEGNEIQYRGISDISSFGAFTFFCSNSCAAYNNKDLDLIGGFRNLLTNEDYVATYDLLSFGKRIAYVPYSLVYHSHRYTLRSEFSRAFDAGYIRGQMPQLERSSGASEGAGVRYAIKFLAATLNYKVVCIPYSLLLLVVRFLGFRIGKLGVYFPRYVNARLSSQEYYWRIVK